MILGILKESGTENRVAMLPGEVTVLKKMGIEVLVELHAGERAFASDDSYVAAGAGIGRTKRGYFQKLICCCQSILLWKRISILSGKARYSVRFSILQKTANGLNQ